MIIRKLDIWILLKSCSTRNLGISGEWIFFTKYFYNILFYGKLIYAKKKKFIWYWIKDPRNLKNIFYGEKYLLGSFLISRVVIIGIVSFSFFWQFLLWLTWVNFFEPCSIENQRLSFFHQFATLEARKKWANIPQKPLKLP